MKIDALPLYAIVDQFRTACATSRVMDTTTTMAVLRRALRTGGRVRPNTFPSFNPNLPWDELHVIDFGYMFNVGSGRDETLTDEEVGILRRPVLDHGIHLAYPHMLFVERTAAVPGIPNTHSAVFLTYVCEEPAGVRMQFFYHDEEDEFGWSQAGLIDRISVHHDPTVPGGSAIDREIQSWVMWVPSHALPEQDDNPANHYLRMAIVLIGALMRRGDEVVEVMLHRDPSKKLSAIAKKQIGGVSIIRLHKQRLMANLRDERDAVPVPTGRVVTPHDRSGSEVERIRDATCEHHWVEEFRNDYRWRNRCSLCGSCMFWRRGAPVRGGAARTTLHKVML